MESLHSSARAAQVGKGSETQPGREDLPHSSNTGTLTL